MPTSSSNNPKPIRTDIIKSARALTEPIVSKIGPALSAIPELLLPSPAGAMPPTKRRKWLGVFLVTVIILISAGGVMYWLSHRSAPQPVAPSQITSQHIDYRNSTFPSAALSVSSQRVDLQVSNLETAPAGASYKLVLVSTGGQDPFVPDLKSASVIDLGDFNIDGDGNIIFANGKTEFIRPASESADQAVVLMGDGNQYSLIMTGRLTLPDDSARTAQLEFPASLVGAQGSLIITKTEGAVPANLRINFNNLPPVENLGYRYEARLVKLVGPKIAKTQTLGRFDATASQTIDIVFSRIDIDELTHLIISLEPTWDKDRELSSMRPYSATIQ
jgi:hypothetical protein